ncbi:hypothetical protein [Aquidulcibacter sp.]|uniref:hypothetical protein n=1 Tax=Aquidulcibacter sp. TaxID=2052990 RepID=UPI0025C26DBC|nr:hypothetical protein [Aquidulcibacter sp.]MCA3692554.1 hypothetical protein [Aquidulcibacter sp.]
MAGDNHQAELKWRCLAQTTKQCPSFPMRYPSVTVITLATVGATLAGSAINARFFEFPKIFGAMLVLGLGLLCFAGILFYRKSDPPKD